MNKKSIVKILRGTRFAISISRCVKMMKCFEIFAVLCAIVFGFFEVISSIKLLRK